MCGCYFYSDYNKLRYNYSFLKTEHENLKVCLCMCLCVSVFIHYVVAVITEQAPDYSGRITGKTSSRGESLQVTTPNI